MSTYAELDATNVVINIIVADAEFIATQTDKTYVEYDETNPANIGDTYDPDTNTFISPYIPEPEPSELIEP